MLIVAVTGRSGSGKSMVAAHFGAKGYPVVDGDEMSRQVTQPGSPSLQELVEAFGQDILDENGALLRQRLGEKAFANPKRNRQLQDILHPAILKETLHLAKEAWQNGAKLFFVDGAMIVGGIFEPYCDKIIVVTSGARLAVSRIILRDGISKQAVAVRLAAQKPESELVAAADYVIENNTNQETLLRRADEVLAQLLRLA